MLSLSHFIRGCLLSLCYVLGNRDVKERHPAPCCKRVTNLCPPRTSEEGVSQSLEGLRVSPVHI